MKGLNPDFQSHEIRGQQKIDYLSIVLVVNLLHFLYRISIHLLQESLPAKISCRQGKSRGQEDE